MAKKVKGATITFEVTDDGTLKQVGRRAKSASKDVDKLGKSAGDTRRNLQSMSGRTESASKSFSRLQQGTGGLVQSYAILASTVFAVTAAFRALENAQNIQQQIKGFKELTKITGTSMLTITNQVRAAADGLLDFQTAAQQTAIATAAGFDSSQIVGLTEGAKNASVALGRDLTDSFNRLIRGVTKAEPELLDELGVILRLDIATRNYAASIGASADKLTIAQRRTAVYNEVQKQLENNFGAIAPKANNLTNNISKFTTKLGDIGIAVSGFVLPAVNALVGFLTRNLPILAGLLGIFALRLLNDVVPGISTVGKKFTDFTTNTEKQIGQLNKDLEKNQKKYDKLTKNMSSSDKRHSAAFKKSLAKRGMSEKDFYAKSAANQKRSISAHINNLKKQEKATGRSMARQIAIQRAAYNKIVVDSKVAGKKIALNINSGLILAEKGFLRLKLMGANALGFLGAQAKKLTFIFKGLGLAMNFAMGAFMIFSIGTMLYDMIPSVKRSKEAMNELGESTKAAQERSKELAVAIGSYKTDKINSIKKALADVDVQANESLQTYIAMDKALSHLSNIFKNNSMEGAERRIMKEVTPGLMINSGMAEMQEAGKIFGNTFIDGLQQAMLADTDKTQDLIDNLLPSGERHSDRIMTLLERLQDPDQAANYNSIIAKIYEQLQFAGMRGGQLFKMEYDKELQDYVPNMTDFGKSLIEGVRNIPKEMITASQSITDMNSALENYVEQLNLAAPKPSELAKRTNALAKVFDQYDAGIDAKDQSLIISKLLTKEELAEAKAKGVSLKLEDIAIFKLQTKLGLTKDQAKVLLDNREVLRKFNTELEAMNKMQKAGNMLHKMELKLINQYNTSYHKRRVLVKEQARLQDQIMHSQAKTADLAVITQKVEEDAKLQRDQKLIDMQLETAELETQLQIIENQLDRFHEVRKTMLESFDKAGQTALTDFIDGGSGTDALKKMAETMKKDMAKQMSGVLMERASGTMARLLKLDKPEEQLTPEAAAIKKVHDEHVNRLELALAAHAKAFEKDYNLGPRVKEDIKDKIKDKVSEKVGAEDEEGGFFGNLFKKIGGIFGTKIGDGTAGDHDAFSTDTIENITTNGGKSKPGLLGTHGGTDLFGIKNAMKSIFGEGGVFHETGLQLFGGKESVFGKLGNSLFGEGGAFSKMFGGGEGGFMGGLGQMFGAGGKGIGGMLSGLLGGGGGGGGLMGLLKPLLSMIPGIGPLLSILPFAKGGIIGNKLIPLASGGVMPRYAKGGVATQPTYLVGEGKKNEAVVPLPDNRSIPVDLGKGAGNTNNTNITVNMTEGGTNTKMEADGQRQLGQAINAAVLAELEKQQRPGGILARV